jgi:hypothetical protein
MSNGKCIDKNPLQRDGTSQQQRMLEALNTDSVQLHGFSMKDWMHFAYEYATKVNFFGVGNDLLAEGNWQNFFIEETGIENFLKDAEEGQDTEPHLSLFIAFLKLMATSQQQLNDITKRHLDFYYKEVLQLKKKEFTADKVFVIFELAKNILEQKVPAGELLDAGKDKQKKSLQYSTEQEIVVNAATAVQLKSVFHQKDKSIRYADIANSLDGLGAPLEKENPVWFAFGHDGSPDKYPALPVARLGFALASQVLLMKEGTRTIDIKLLLEAPAGFNTTVFNGLVNRTTALITGAKSWINATVQSVSVTKNGTIATCAFTFLLDAKEDAVVSYDAAIHQEHYTTDLPIVRVLFEAIEDNGYEDYMELSKARMNSVTIDVKVEGYKGFIAENDNGVLDVSKPFMPFGVIPQKGSGFYLGSSEIFQKKWNSISFDIAWKDRPDDFREHYMAYKSRFLSERISRQSYDLVYKTVKVNNVDKVQLQNDNGNEVTGDDYFTVDVSYVKNGKWATPQNKELFEDVPLVIDSTEAQNNSFYLPSLLFQTGFNQNKFFIQQYYANTYAAYSVMSFNPGFIKADTGDSNFSGNVKDNFLKISLVEDFLHQYYARLYAVAMSVEGGVAVIPKEPYTPVIASLTATYTASAQNDFNFIGSANTPANKLSNYSSRNVQLFHETPFGQAEQHVFLREQSFPPAVASRIALLPVYESEGEFLIGLKNATTGSIVSILFEVAEGSENPEAPSFDQDTKIEWFGLGNNEWKPFGSEFILSDSTNNFLKPGIISFLLPKEMNESNTILSAGYLWLRAKLPAGTHFDSVSRFVEVKAQAVQAVFKNNDNELSHLYGSLPAGAITKLTNRLGGIKKVIQPFNSFDGAPEESDNDFYLRISERLRHKNRAINIWDYERLILAKFPDVFKVKCLNHTSTKTNISPGYEIDPGYVTLIPVPDVRNKNLYNILQPKVSSNKLREIEDYIRNLNSMHIEFAAAQPDYEEVMFRFTVKFHKQYDPNAYVKILNEELKQYLAPWAYDSVAQISFGGILYKSVIIGFIEEREYVDFITDFKMIVDGGNDQKEVKASTSRSILTTVQQHDITAMISNLIC